MIKKLILHTMITEKRNIIFSTAIMAAAILLGATICAGSYVDDMNTMRINYCTAIVMAKCAIFFCMIASASNMMAPLRTRRSSVQYLMLPASNRDKFLSRWIIGVVGYTLMFFVALIGADVVQALYNITLRYTTGSVTVAFLSDIFEGGFLFFDGNMPIVHSFFESIIAFLWFHSVYTLGSTFFRSHSFIKTTLLFIGVMILASVVFVGMFVPMVYSNKEYTIHFLVDPEVMKYITFYTLSIGTIVVAYWWSYSRFCKKMIV